MAVFSKVLKGPLSQSRTVGVFVANMFSYMLGKQGGLRNTKNLAVRIRTLAFPGMQALRELL